MRCRTGRDRARRNPWKTSRRLEIKENRTRTAPRRLLSSILLRLAFGGGGSLTVTKLCRTNRAVGRTEVVYRSQVCGLANCAVIPLVKASLPHFLTSSLLVGASSFPQAKARSGRNEALKKPLGENMLPWCWASEWTPTVPVRQPNMPPRSGIYGGTKAKPSVSSPGPTALLSELRSIRIVGKLLASRRFFPHLKTLT